MRSILTSLFELAGAGLVAVGVGAYSWPAGLIVAGAEMIVFAYRAAE